VRNLIIIVKNRERFFSRLLFSISITVISSILFCSFYYIVTSYMHEFGHISGGILSDILAGNNIQNYTISNWIISPIFFMIPIPQQTRIPDGVLNTSIIFLGGVVTTILLIFLICFIVYIKCDIKTKGRVWFVLLFTIIIQIVNNFFCGTDNPFLKPYILCEENNLISFLFYWGPIILFCIFFSIIFPLIYENSPFWIDRIQNKLGQKAEYL